jgi:two-component system chemotaxis response regulator CheY
MKALVVDDSLTIRKIIAKALQQIGIESVVEAENGAVALTAVSEHSPDLILMDWNMPQMSGIEALTKLRGQGCKTPVIMVTTEAEKSRVIEAIKAGANDYLIKPFAPEQLAEKAKRMMPTPAA